MAETSDPVLALLREVARAPERALADERARLAIGQRLGRFELVREIGRGGFGVVYEALDTELGRRVALKVMRRDRMGDNLDLFRREAQAAAALNHPNVVALYDHGIHEDMPYLVLELVPGETVAQRISERPLREAEAVALAIQIATGLAHAHAAGVMHRDLKPANLIVMPDGRLKILDFGLARSLSGGTPAFMAPEQRRGEAGDARTDLYSFGMTLHVMLTGKLPEAELDRALRPELAGLIRRLVATEPTERPTGCTELLAALGELAGVPAPTVEHVPALERPESPRVRRRFVGVAAVAVVAIALLWVNRTPEPDTPIPTRERSLPVSPEAAQLYLDGIAAHRAWEVALAREKLEYAVALEPGFAPAHRALAETLSLGDMPRARREAELAVAGAAQVSTSDQLEIAAFHRALSGDTAAAAELYRRLRDRHPSDREIGLATVDAEVDANALADARISLDRVRELPVRSLDDEILLELAEAHLADARGDYRTAQTAAARAAVKAKSAGAKRRLLAARDIEQWALYNLGEPLRAREAVEAVRQLHVELGNHDGAVRAQQHLATLAMERGELADARRLYDGVIAHFRPLGFDRISMTLSFVVDLELRRGRLAEVDRALDELSAHGPNASYRPAIAYHDVMLGRRLAARGDLAAARARFEAAERVYREFDDNRSLATTLVVLGRLLLAQHDLAGARSRLEEAHTIRRTLGAKRTIAETQTALAELALADGKPDVAEPLAREAEVEMTRQGALDAAALAASVRARARPIDTARILAPYEARRSESAEVRTYLAIAKGDPRELAAVIADNHAAGLVELERVARGR